MSQEEEKQEPKELEKPRETWSEKKRGETRSEKKMKMTILNFKYVSPGKRVEPLLECRRRVGRAERRLKNMSLHTRRLDHGADIALKAEQTIPLIQKKIEQRRAKNQRSQG